MYRLITSFVGCMDI